VALRLVRSTPARAVSGLRPAIVLCSWARHFTLTVPLSTLVGNGYRGEFNVKGSPAVD